MGSREPQGVGADLLGDAIERPRLVRTIEASSDARLTSIVAPAGWGKSVLLASWARRQVTPVAWLELTRPDNDAGRLIRSLHVGLSPYLDPSTRESAGRIDYLTAAAVPGRIEELAHGLRVDENLAIVLDDIHLLSDPISIEALQRFVEAIPPGVRLVTSARHDPPFPVSRLRLTGQLAEIRQRDLAFTRGEIETLLSTEGVTLETEALEAFIARTGGWGAAIRLALIAMRQSGDPNRVAHELAGTDRIVSEYLVDEVLSELDETTRRFLLQTSVVEQMSGPLTTVLTGRADAEQVLEQLVEAGAFTSRTAEPGWYRYHHLLREFLHLRLRSTDESSSVALHRTAANWFDAEDRPVPAIEHALAAGDIELASQWVEAAVTPLVNAGLGQTIADLAEQVGRATDTPPLSVVLARMFALYSIGNDPDAIDHLLDILIAAAESDRPLPTEGGDPRSMIDPLPWLVGLKARKHGDLEIMLGLDDPDNIPSPSGRVEAWIAEGALWAERFERADELLVVYRQHAELDQDVYPPSTLHALGLTAYSLVAQGRPGDADRVLSRARSLIDRLRSGHLVHTLYAQLAEAQAHWERGNLPEAESALVEMQEHADRFGDVPVAAMLAMLRSRNRWSLGDRTGAFALLESAEVMPTGGVIGGHFARRITLEKCRLDVLAGDLEAARLRLPDRSSRLTAADEPLRDLIVLARVAIALGEHHPTIDQLIAHDTASPSQEIDLALLRAAHACAHGDTSAAIDALAHAMRVATDTGTSQRVVDERPPFGAAYTAAARHSGFAADETGVATPALVAPLTDRELEVLTKLTTQLTYQEIADDLFVSQNTVKSHTAAIYRKLAVTRRTDAVNRARELGLLSD